MSQPLSPLAARLARQVAAARNKRILVAEVFTAAQEHDLSLVGDPAARARFRQALDELAGASLVALPSAASRSGWDAIVEPPLPVWVTRVDHQAGGPTVRPAPRVWPSALEAAGRVATRLDEHVLLESVAGWLRDNPAPVRVPAGERSAELFGDEKALDRYRKTRLFTSGALTLDLLACSDPPLPFASQHVPGNGPVILLVAENLATYTSFLSAARALDVATRPDLHVAWGSGGSFEQSVLSTPLLHPSPRHVRYFGDLDLAGLRIASRAAADLPSPTADFLCTMVLARRAFRLPSYRLPFVAAECNVELSGRHQVLINTRGAALITVAPARQHKASTPGDLTDALDIRMGHLRPPDLYVPCARRDRRGSGRDRLVTPDASPDADPDHPMYGQVIVFTGALKTRDQAAGVGWGASPARTWTGSCPGTPAPRTSAPGHSRRQHPG